MEHYLSHTDYPIWQVIHNGNGHVSVIIDTNNMIKVLPPKTAEEVVAREGERKARTTLLMALPEDHLEKFHKMADAKEMHYCIIINHTECGFCKKGSSSYTDEGIHFFFANQSSAPQLDYDDIEQINDNDMEEIDLKQQTKVECFNCYKMRHFARDYRAKGNQDSRRRDAGYNGNKARDNGRRPAYQDDLKALQFSSDNDVKSCSKICEESYARLKKLYDEQRDKLGDASVEIIADTLALKRLLNTQMSANDKFGLGYDDYRYGSILSYENKVLQSVFMNKESDLENTSVNDRYNARMHAIPPPMTGNYMPSGPDVDIDYSKFTYGPKQTSVDETNSKPKTTTSMPDPVAHALKVVCKPKVWTDAPIIEEYESDSDNDSENVKSTGTSNHCPKIRKQGRNGHTRKGLGYAFTRKACFVYGSFSHIIRDCDFHEKRMAKQVELATSRKKVFGQGETRPVWNNVQKVNHQNKFVPLALLTKTGKFLVNASRQNTSSQGASTSTASKVNTAKTFVNETGPKRHFYKTHSPNKRPFHNRIAQRTTFLHLKVNTVHTSLSAVKGNGDTGVKASAGNKAHLADYQKFKGGSVAFGGSNGRITSKGKIKADRLDFEDVYYVEELKHYNLFSVSQMCDKKNKALFTNTACLVLSPDFKLLDENQAEEVNTACYVLNRVLVTKPQNKTPYELLTSKQPIISYLRPFRCHMTILNTIDQLGKFDRKSNLGFLVRYSLNSKAFRLYNLETKRVEENLHVNFLENKPNVEGKRHAWMFDLDYLTNSMNYEPVLVENQANKFAGLNKAKNSVGTQDNDDHGANTEEIYLHEEHLVLPICQVEQIFQEELEKLKRQEKEANDAARKEATHEIQNANTNSTNLLNDVSTPISTTGPSRAFNDGEPSYLDDPLMPHLEDIYASPSEGIFTDSSYDNEGVTRSKVKKNSKTYALVSYIQKQQRNNHKNFQHCLFACFLSQIKPKKISQALEDKSWVDAMQQELLQFQIQKVWILVDLPFGKKAIGTKWFCRNKKDERGVVVRNKALLVAQGHRQEERIDYDEVFAPVARIESIRIFLAFAFYIGFIVYQIDMKSAFLYGTIDEEVYVTQPPSFVDPKFPNKVYNVVKAQYGLHQAPRAWYATLSTFLEQSRYRRGAIDKT
nr:putative ribonuclease H-like domain-containing protein [Tanacetum cinerariifolium]